MSNTPHNGWTNYATWRVNLEIIDSYDFKDFLPYPDIASLKDEIKDIVDETVLNEEEGLAYDYAHAFLSEVNYYEIAEHIITKYPNILITTLN